MKRERILVTGGAGFIGSHCVELLLTQGKQVVVLDNLASGRIDNLDLTHPAIEFFEGDILEYPLVADLISSCDAVLHLAAIASVPLSIAEPIYALQVNEQGFLHVLEAIRKAGRAIRLVYASSAAVYGDAPLLPCADTQPLLNELLSPYALHKKHNEEWADLYYRLHGIKSLGMRFFNVYGPRQCLDSYYSGVISRFMQAFQQDAPLTIYGDGMQSRDFIYVTDIARANMLALEAECMGAMNVATGKASTLLQLIECMERAYGKQAAKGYQPARVGDIKASYANVSLLAAELKFHAQISLEEGISQLSKSI